MPRECATDGCTQLTDSGICKMCSAERQYGTTARAYNPDGSRKVDLRDGETRDDDNTHARRNAAQLAEADAELREELEARHGDGAEDDGPGHDLIMEGSDQ